MYLFLERNMEKVSLILGGALADVTGMIIMIAWFRKCENYLDLLCLIGIIAGEHYYFYMSFSK